jgi:hypothetical protein
MFVPNFFFNLKKQKYFKFFENLIEESFGGLSRLSFYLFLFSFYFCERLSHLS